MDDRRGELRLSPLMARLRPFLVNEAQPVYLVGGAVRDALLGERSHDLDFVLAEGAVALAYRVGDALGAPAYVLDRERDTGRVVLAESDTMLDFSCFRGPDLTADLRARDFTINALALPAAGTRLDDIIDSTGGLADLAARRLRLTHAGALEADPVRCLRAVRLAIDLQFTMMEETRRAVRQSGPRLAASSAERVRDELLKMLHNAGSDTAVAELAELGVLPIVLPEIAALADLPQSPPHHEAVLAHTISVLSWLEALEEAVRQNPAAVMDPALAEAAALCEPYRAQLRKHLTRTVDGNLDGRHVLYLSALFHDAGKAETQSRDEDGQIHFYGHDEAGAALAEVRLRALCLSNDAINQVNTIVAEHMRPLLLAQAQGADPTRRAAFRFFKRTGSNGLDVILLALADHLATYDGPGPRAAWQTLLGLSTALLAQFFERFEQSVRPEPLLGGRDLMEALDLTPGPQIGELLRLIEEAQAAGELHSREEALRFAAERLG